MKKPDSKSIDYRKIVADVRKIINGCNPDFAEPARMVIDIAKAVYPGRMPHRAAKIVRKYSERYEYCG